MAVAIVKLEFGYLFAENNLVWVIDSAWTAMRCAKNVNLLAEE